MDAHCSQSVPQTSSRATAVAHAWLRQPVHDELVYQAHQRRDHTDALAARILTAVLVLGLADELLDKAARLLENV